MPSVLQDWVQELTYMQQSVLITACRGPDSIEKNHVSKLILRWMRRCFLLSAFGGNVLNRPYISGGGSFTGPSMGVLNHEDPAFYERNDYLAISSLNTLAATFFQKVDEIPHHFYLHLMHAAEILGYKHPEEWTRKWWNDFYNDCVNDMHLNPESELEMDRRLSDNESKWREREKHPAN